MRTYLLIATLLLGFCHKPLAQQIFTYVEQMPEFPGGQASMYEFINEHIKYPEIARMNEISGRVTVRFVVDSTGNVVNPVIQRSVYPLLDKEVLRLVGKMPKWKPGMMNGKNVNTYFTLPVVFKLDGAGASNNQVQAPYYKGDIDSALHIVDLQLGQGLVIVSVIINRKGLVEKPKVVSGTSEALGEQATKVVMALNPTGKDEEPTWVPATKDGEPIPFEMQLPVYFNRK